MCHILPYGFPASCNQCIPDRFSCSPAATNRIAYSMLARWPLGSSKQQRPRKRRERESYRVRTTSKRLLAASGWLGLVSLVTGAVKRGWLESRPRLPMSCRERESRGLFLTLSFAKCARDWARCSRTCPCVQPCRVIVLKVKCAINGSSGYFVGHNRPRGGALAVPAKSIVPGGKGQEGHVPIPEAQQQKLKALLVLWRRQRRCP